jgi:hypothetical protein
METLTAADFTPYLHRPFVVQLTGDEAYALELVEVREIGEAYVAGGRRPFSLLFVHPRRDAYLPQHTYRLEFERLPGSTLGEPTAAAHAALDLFLVPLGPQPGGMQYQAIFS